MSDVSITLEDNGKKGRYVAHVAGQSDVGEMTFSRINDKLIIVDHTGVPESLGGKGVGRALIDGVYERARLAGSPRVYWLTHETNDTAMQLYDKVAERPGFVVYRKML